MAVVMGLVGLHPHISRWRLQRERVKCLSGAVRWNYHRRGLRVDLGVQSHLVRSVGLCGGPD